MYSARGLVGLGVQVGYADGAGFWNPRLIALIGARLAALVPVPAFCNQGPVNGTVHRFVTWPCKSYLKSYRKKDERNDFLPQLGILQSFVTSTL